MRRLAALCVVLSAASLVWAGAGHAAKGEQDLASLTNSDRASFGRPALAMAGDLQSLAQRRAEEMAAARRLSHTQDLGSRVSNWRKLGENVGRGKSLTEIEHSYMASEPHRENILAPDFTEMGVGVAAGGDQIYTAVIFRLPMEQSAPKPAPAPPPAPKPAPRPAPVVKAAAPAPPPPPPTTTTMATAPPAPPPAPVEVPPPPPVETTTTVTVAAPPVTMPAWFDAPIDPPVQRIAAGMIAATLPGDSDPGIPGPATAAAIASLLASSALLGTVARGRLGRNF